MAAIEQGRSCRLSEPATWVNQHGDTLYGFARRHVRNAAVAEDLVQETFVAALKGQAGFAGQASEQSWFVGILKNKIRDHFRTVAREASLKQPEGVIDDCDDNFVRGGPDHGSWQPAHRPARWMIDPDDPAEEREFWVHLQRCLETLDGRHALLFVLREVHEAESAELCDVFNLTPANIRIILHRARRLLRACLERKWLRSRSSPAGETA